ncbi:MAG TPA: alpha/beta hydrolase, partial [Polyangiales bacterium]|nr:alpha/beta hydrolase [Polyangiales bacterium]
MRVRFLAFIGVMGCASWLPAPEPMRAIDHERPGPRAACLFVFLPGQGDSPEGFERNGFVDDVARRRYSIDMVAADATLGYYTRGVFSERLARDVLLRRKQRGYKEVWLVGNSMGGFGSLLYSRQRPVGEVTGVLALAPYLGSDSELLASIVRDGGLARWHAPSKVATLNEHNYDRELWRWLKEVAAKNEPGPELYLGFGDRDKLYQPDSVLAAALPSDHV